MWAKRIFWGIVCWICHGQKNRTRHRWWAKIIDDDSLIVLIFISLILNDQSVNTKW